jgi:hypothetical protein
VDKLRVGAYDHLDDLRPDHVMTGTDNCPHRLIMDAGADLGAGPFYMSILTQQNCSGPVTVLQLR